MHSVADFRLRKGEACPLCWPMPNPSGRCRYPWIPIIALEEDGALIGAIGRDICKVQGPWRKTIMRLRFLDP